MVVRLPLVLISGVAAELPASGTITGVDTGVLTAGSGLKSTGNLTNNQTIDVELSSTPNGLIFADTKLALDGQTYEKGVLALASGNAAIDLSNSAVASGNAALEIGTEALASGTAALEIAEGAAGGFTSTYKAGSDIVQGFPVGLDDNNSLQTIRASYTSKVCSFPGTGFSVNHNLGKDVLGTNISGSNQIASLEEGYAAGLYASRNRSTGQAQLNVAVIKSDPSLPAGAEVVQTVQVTGFGDLFNNECGILFDRSRGMGLIWYFLTSGQLAFVNFQYSYSLKSITLSTVPQGSQQNYTIDAGSSAGCVGVFPGQTGSNFFVIGFLEASSLFLYSVKNDSANLNSYTINFSSVSNVSGGCAQNNPRFTYYENPNCCLYGYTSRNRESFYFWIEVSSNGSITYASNEQTVGTPARSNQLYGNLVSYKDSNGDIQPVWGGADGDLGITYNVTKGVIDAQNKTVSWTSLNEVTLPLGYTSGFSMCPIYSESDVVRVLSTNGAAYQLYAYTYDLSSSTVSIVPGSITTCGPLEPKYATVSSFFPCAFLNDDTNEVVVTFSHSIAGYPSQTYSIGTSGYLITPTKDFKPNFLGLASNTVASGGDASVIFPGTVVQTTAPGLVPGRDVYVDPLTSGFTTDAAPNSSWYNNPQPTTTGYMDWPNAPWSKVGRAVTSGTILLTNYV